MPPLVWVSCSIGLTTLRSPSGVKLDTECLPGLECCGLWLVSMVGWWMDLAIQLLTGLRAPVRGVKPEPFAVPCPEPVWMIGTG